MIPFMWYHIIKCVITFSVKKIQKYVKYKKFKKKNSKITSFGHIIFKTINMMKL